jgi:hypothetical protein
MRLDVSRAYRLARAFPRPRLHLALVLCGGGSELRLKISGVVAF